MRTKETEAIIVLIYIYKIHILKVFAPNIGQCPRIIPVCPGVALRLFIPQVSVETGTVFKKHFVGPTLLHAAVLQNLNFVSVQHRRKSVGDHDRSSVFREATQSAENVLKAKRGKVRSYRDRTSGGITQHDWSIAVMTAVLAGKLLCCLIAKIGKNYSIFIEVFRVKKNVVKHCCWFSVKLYT